MKKKPDRTVQTKAKRKPRSKERGPARFSQTEIDRAIRSVENAGLKIRNVIVREIKIECHDGTDEDKQENILPLIK